MRQRVLRYLPESPWQGGVRPHQRLTQVFVSLDHQLVRTTEVAPR